MEKTKNNKKIGLALSGGSALGIAHIGALKVLKENNINIDCIAGTSAGSFVAALFAFGVSLEKMIAISKKLNWSEIADFDYSKMGFNSNKELGEIVRETLGDVNIEDAKIPLAIVTADIDTGEKLVLRKGNLAQAVMASSAIPAFFVPVKIGRRNLVDGGIVENLPLSSLDEMGAEVKIGVDLGCWRVYKKTKNILDVINNSYSILIRHQNVYAHSAGALVIQPHLEKFTTSDFKKCSQLLKAGELATELKIKEIKKEIRKSSGPENFWQKTWDFFNLREKWENLF